jgi:D-tyrosyl-tRNA(Tyr) deacylase
MRALLQRVSKAEVRVADEIVGAIGRGLLVLLGVGKEDGPQEAAFLADKTAGLRIFEDLEGKMNLSVEQIGGEILVVSQFTLYADCRKGRRPSFTDAAPPLQADQLYQAFAEALKARGLKVATGNFGEKMEVELTNDGPVTIMLDSTNS